MFLAFFSLSVALAPAAAKTLFEQGEGLFLQNKPGAAAVLLENALKSEPNNPKIYLYLGICYEQLGQNKRAIGILSQGVSHADETSGTDPATFYFDIGNNYYALKELDQAEQMYTKAILLNGSFADPYLNRANLLVETKDYKKAVTDYTVYLGLKPNDPQAATIQKMIDLLNGEITAEQQRVATEKKKKAEEEARRKAFLQNVLKSLNNAPSDTTNLSGGNATIENQNEPLDIAP